MTEPAGGLSIRWLGRVTHGDARALQHGLLECARGDHLLLLEHPHTFTLGRNADGANVLVDPSTLSAEVVRTDRGGDVTYHGPGQLVGYPVLTLGAPGRGHGVAEHVAQLEGLLIGTLGELGLPAADRRPGFPGVWVGLDSPRPEKVAAIGVRASGGRTMHGFALNVAPDLSMFDAIVPCGITDGGVTSLAALGVEVDMERVVDIVTRRAAALWGNGDADIAAATSRMGSTDLAPFSRGLGPGEKVAAPTAGVEATPTDGAAERTGGTSVRLQRRLDQAGVTGGLTIGVRKPDWMRSRVRLGEAALEVARTMRDLDLVTVCEEAGCPNLSECWSDGTATFMINGERCTRACGFCLVDTRKPVDLDPDEPRRVAEAAARMGLTFAVVTAVARDDLPDGGAAAFASTITALREECPGIGVEVLIPDCKGDAGSLSTIFEARPDVLNHNIETVLRLQRAVRPSASYARSLSVLARAREAGLTTKSSIIVGLGETRDEVDQTLSDLAAVGTDIVTVGQYLRPTTHHLPISQWWTPEEFSRWADVGTAFGIGHVESSPLTRSSYHARQAAEAAS